MSKSRGCLALAFLLCTGISFANDDPDRLAVLKAADALDDTPGIESAGKPKTWDLRLGILGGVHPDYLGSNDYEADAAPYFRINWKDRIILSGRAIYARVINGGPLSLGPLIRLRGGRDEDDNDDLEGLGDDDNAVEVGGFARYKHGPYRLRLTATQDVADGHHGALVEVGAGMQVPFAQPWFLLMGQMTWADQNYMNSYFGVSANEAARSGLRQFHATAGVRDVGFTLSTSVPIWRKLAFVSTVNYSRLLGDAADSPLTEDVGDANQFSATFGLIYRF